MRYVTNSDVIGLFVCGHGLVMWIRDQWSAVVVSIWRQSSPIVVTERWDRSWSQCTGSQLAGYCLSHPPAVGCRYFLPGLRSPSQSKNVTILRPVPCYTAWWQRHIRVNNLTKVVMQLCPCENWTHDLLITSATTLICEHITVKQLKFLLWAVNSRFSAIHTIIWLYQIYLALFHVFSPLFPWRWLSWPDLVVTSGLGMFSHVNIAITVNYTEKWVKQLNETN